MTFVARNRVLGLTVGAVEHAAAHYARLRQMGTPVDDIDLLIAGIALDHDLAIVTRNRGHFERISGLRVADWSETTDPAENP